MNFMQALIFSVPQFYKPFRNYPFPGVLPTEHQTKIPYSSSPHIAQPANLDYCMRIQHSDCPTMNIDEDTSTWLGCPTPLEMYKHQCALLEDELTTAYRLLSKARANVAGLVQMNDLLATGKASAETALREALERISAMGNDQTDKRSFRSVDLVTDQRDHLFRENQRLLLELKVFTGAQP